MGAAAGSVCADLFCGDLAGSVLLDVRAPTGAERTSCTRYVRLLAGRRTDRLVADRRVALVLGARVRRIPVVPRTRSRVLPTGSKPDLLRLSLLTPTLPPLSLRALSLLALGLFASPSRFALLSVLTPQSFQAAFSVLASPGVFVPAGVLRPTGLLVPDRFVLAAGVVGLRGAGRLGWSGWLGCASWLGGALVAPDRFRAGTGLVAAWWFLAAAGLLGSWCVRWLKTLRRPRRLLRTQPIATTDPVTRAVTAHTVAGAVAQPVAGAVASSR